jgi:hypothetical protein
MKYMSLNSEIGVNLQKLYDELGTTIERLEAQRAALRANPNICTHPLNQQETNEFEGGKSITHCTHCRRVIRVVGFDCVSEEAVNCKTRVISNLCLWRENELSGRTNQS